MSRTLAPFAPLAAGSLLALLLGSTAGCPPAQPDDDSAMGADDAGDDDSAIGDDDAGDDDADDDSAAGDDDADDDSAIGDDDAGDDDSAAPGCEQAADDLAELIYADIGSCTGVVRLDHDTMALLGWQLVCGPYAFADEAGARAAAQATTGHGASGTALGPSPPSDQWVFYQSPGDFGGVATVSAHTGLPTFGGSIVWDGSGEISWPVAWEGPEALASGCPAAPAPPATSGYDLVAGASLAGADLAAALAVVTDTALPSAFWQGGYLFDAVVLLYPRSVGEFDPATAEWIVLLDGGWLE